MRAIGLVVGLGGLDCRAAMGPGGASARTAVAGLLRRSSIRRAGQRRQIGRRAGLAQGLCGGSCTGV